MLWRKTSWLFIKQFVNVFVAYKAGEKNATKAARINDAFIGCIRRYLHMPSSVLDVVQDFNCYKQTLLSNDPSLQPSCQKHPETISSASVEKNRCTPLGFCNQAAEYYWLVCLMIVKAVMLRKPSVVSFEEMIVEQLTELMSLFGVQPNVGGMKMLGWNARRLALFMYREHTVIKTARFWELSV